MADESSGGLEFSLKGVLESQDGGWDCWDTVLSAGQIARLYRTGFLQVDEDRQRGKDLVTGRPVVNRKKIEQWADQLGHGGGVFGQLTWNFRREDGEIEYEDGKLTIVSRATLPDSRHRHMAIVQAVEAAERGGSFDDGRKFSVRIFNVPAVEENKIFYAMNQEGQKADATRSKWLHPSNTGQRIASELVRRSRHLTQDNVDTIRNQLSKRNPRLVAFNTLARAFEEHWSDAPTEESEFEAVLDYLLKFWDQLVTVLPRIGKLDLSARQRVREISLVDSAVAIAGYVYLARRFWEEDIDTIKLDALRDPAFLSRTNPRWTQEGILVTRTRKDGTQALTIRNAKESKEAMLSAMAEKVGLGGDTAPTPAATVSVAS